MALDKPNIALQDIKIKKPPHRVNAHLPLGLYVDAKKNVLVLADLARNSAYGLIALQDLNIALQVAQ